MTENPLIDQLKELEQEHRDLDEVLIQLQEKQTVDFQQIQRLKKRKLILKDRIIFIKNKTKNFTEFILKSIKFKKNFSSFMQ